MSEVMEFIKGCENGATEEMLTAQFPDMKKIELANVLNSMLQKSQIELFKSGNRIYYKSIHNKTADYETMIMSLIAQSGSSGLWLRDIKNKTNIPHNLVLKILKVLEDTRRIKSIKSVKNNRRTFVLYDVKPDEDVSGGVWFCNNDVDSIFVTKLMDVIYRFVHKPEDPFVLNKISNLVKLDAIRDFISGSGISEVELSMSDVNTLIDCLCYDGRLERIETDNGVALRALKDEYMKL